MDERDGFPDIIPVFPLPGALLLPGTHLPLHIFEPRYRRMIADAMAGPGLVGMIQPRRAAQVAPPHDLAAIGCVGRLVQVAETEDGRYFVVLEGLTRFRTVAEAPGNEGYRRLKVRFDEFARDLDESEEDIDTRAVHQQLERWIVAGPGSEALAELPPARQVNVLAAALPFGEVEKQALLEADCLLARRDLLVALLAMGFDDEAATPTVH
jgi:Lon protease-like protein